MLKKSLITQLFIICLISFTPLKAKESRHPYDHAAELFGDVGQYLIPGAGLFMTVRLRDNLGMKQFIKAGIASQLTSAALKYSIQAERPNHHNCSFPSGHTTMAFFGAGFISKRYGMKYGLPALGAAVLVGYSRWQINQHWVSDILAGAAIGFFYNWLFTTRYEGKMCVYPVVTRDSIALCCDYDL